MTISAAFTVNAASNPARHITTYGATVNLALVNTAGIDQVTWAIVGSSNSGDTLPSVTPSGTPTGATASFTFLADPSDGLGRTLRIRCSVSGSGQTATQYAVVGVENDVGRLPVAAGEELDRDATYGWTDELNAGLYSTSEFVDTDLNFFSGETVQSALETADQLLSDQLGRENDGNSIEVASTATANVDWPLGFAAADGLYVVTVVVLGTIVGGTKYRSIWRVVCERASGTVTPVAELIYPGPEPAQMTTVFSNNAGNLRSAVTNNSGAVMNVHYYVASKLHTYPTAPT